jgi:hypothetical protein
MRMHGISCGPLDRAQIHSVMKVADLYGFAPQQPVSGALYQYNFDTLQRKLITSHVKRVSSGPHEGFWLIFHNLEELTIQILSANAGIIRDQQTAATKTEELRRNLSFAGASRGNWLSTVRNQVNYDQRFATWFPFLRRMKYYDQLFPRVDEWKTESTFIDLSSHEGRDLRRFQATCNFILALCRESISEMSRRCLAGKSFHEFGSLAFSGLSEQPRHGTRSPFRQR